MIQEFFNNQTVVSSIGLQARDWVIFTNMLSSDEAYEDMLFQLKQQWRVANPPSGTTVVYVVDILLGNFLKFHHAISHLYGKEIAKLAYNRIDAVLTTLANTYPDITAYKAALNTFEIETENYLSTTGRKILRGKLP